MATEKILDKIRKLLALANGTSSAEESHSAMVLARRMMAEHGLSEASVEGVRDDDPEVVHGEVFRTRYRSTFVGVLGGIIAKNFRCKVYWMKQSVGWSASGKSVSTYTLRFVGLREDAEVAATTFHAARTAAEALATRFVQRNGGGKTARTSYLLGWVDGLKRRFQEDEAEMSTSLVLALRTPSVVEEAYNAISLSKSTARPIRRVDYAALEEGRKDGQQFGRGLEA